MRPLSSETRSVTFMPEMEVIYCTTCTHLGFVAAKLCVDGTFGSGCRTAAGHPAILMKTIWNCGTQIYLGLSRPSFPLQSSSPNPILPPPANRMSLNPKANYTIFCFRERQTRTKGRANGWPEQYSLNVAKDSCEARKERKLGRLSLNSPIRSL